MVTVTGAPQRVVNVVGSSRTANTPLTQVQVIPFDSLQTPNTARLLQTRARLVQTPRLIQTLPQTARLTTTLPQTVFQEVVPQSTRLATVQAQPTLVREAPRAQYRFGYSVADTTTGDSKVREEERDGDVVRGSYSVADPDGRIRTVTYTADALNGFQAQVTYDGQEGPPSIGINAPDTAEIISTRTPTVVSLDAVPLESIPTIQTVRGAAAIQTVGNVVTALPQRTAARLVNAEPTVVRTVPQTTLLRSDATHLVHAEPSVLRTVPQTTVLRNDATHLVHAEPSVVRTVPQTTVLRNDATHLVHAEPSVIRTVPQTTVVRNDATHLVHAEPTVVRAVQPTQVLRTVPQVVAARTGHTVHHSRTHPTSVVTPGRLLHLGAANQLSNIQVVGLDSLSSLNGAGSATIIEA